MTAARTHNRVAITPWLGNVYTNGQERLPPFLTVPTPNTSTRGITKKKKLSTGHTFAVALRLTSMLTMSPLVVRKQRVVATAAGSLSSKSTWNRACTADPCEIG